MADQQPLQTASAHIIWLSAALQRVPAPDRPRVSSPRCAPDRRPDFLFFQRRTGLRSGPARRPTLSCLEEICGKILLCQKEEAFGSNALSHIYLLEFLIYLNRAYFSRPSMFHKEYLENEKVNEVLAYIDENLSSDLTLERLADLCFISKYHLAHQFKACTGMPVYRYIIKQRVTAARNLICSGLSATEACMQCGFNDYSNFLKAFKREFGCTPKAFQKQR